MVVGKQVGLSELVSKGAKVGSPIDNPLVGWSQTQSQPNPGERHDLALFVYDNVGENDE